MKASRSTTFFLLQTVVSATIALLVIPQQNPPDYGSTLQPPSTVAILTCIVSNVSSPTNFTTRWFVNATTELRDSGRYIARQGTAVIQGLLSIVTVLTIQNLTYKDEGNYTCSASPMPLQSMELSSSATQQLSLPAGLEILNSSVLTVNISDPSPVQLWCEMFKFIRPDSSFLWYRNNNERLTTGSKYDIKYSWGTRKYLIEANSTSRLSVLTISNFTSNDLGNYSCRVGDEAVPVYIVNFNTPARTSKLQVNGDSKLMFTLRVIKATEFEKQSSESAGATCARLHYSLPLIVSFLVLCYVAL